MDDRVPTSQHANMKKELTLQCISNSSMFLWVLIFNHNAHPSRLQCIFQNFPLKWLLCLHWNRHFLQLNYANVDLHLLTSPPKHLQHVQNHLFWKTILKKTPPHPIWVNIYIFLPSLIHTLKQKRFFDSESIPIFKFYTNFTNAM